MDNAESQQPLDAPQRIQADKYGRRYGITKRLASEWIRRAITAGVLKRIGRTIVGIPRELDAWVAAGGVVPPRKRGGK